MLLVKALALLVAACTPGCSAFGLAPHSGIATRAVAHGTPPVARSGMAVMKRSAAERDVLELEGTVLEAMRGADFRVKIDDIDQDIVCRISGKIRKFRIKILVGDRVTVEVSPYDLTKGRITFRKR